MDCNFSVGSVFNKYGMSQIVPTIGSLMPDAYEAYAETFDLSLLPSDCIDLPMSPQSDVSSHSPQVSLEYIPTTIYHDQLPTIKTEKVWNDESMTVMSEHHQNDTNMLMHHQQQYNQKQYQLYPQQLQSDGVNKNLCQTVFPPSPCPSIEYNFANTPIKQEYHILPPSPPESSCGALSPHSFTDIKSEPENDVEALIDINSLLENSLNNLQPKLNAHDRKTSDHQLLREYLEDTSFQKKHNLKPLALESLIGGLGGHSDIEPVISLALEHAKRDAHDICSKLQISIDPQQWSAGQVHAWLRTTIEQFQLPQIDDLENKFPDDGTTFSLLSEEDFIQRAPEFGSTLHAQLEVWKVACCAGFSNDLNSMHTNGQNWSSECSSLNNMDFTDDEDEEMLPVTNTAAVPSTVSLSVSATQPAAATTTTATATTTPATTTTRSGGSHIHLWQFLKELLSTPQVNGTAIRWLDRSKGVFKIEDSVRVAKLWGRRKNRPAMNYDKLSRSIRQYYKKGIMKKTERSQRLVYQFCHPYCL